MYKKNRTLYLLGLILTFLIFSIPINSFAVQGAPGSAPTVEPQMENPGGPIHHSFCELYRGWKDCNSAFRWAQQSRNPQRCWDCITTCYTDNRRGYPGGVITTHCKRRCITYGHCS